MDFAILNGAGNAFALATSRELGARDPAQAARELCAAHGLDGLLEVRPAAADGQLGMVVWNSDGSRAETCGNGLRCVALFARERGLAGADLMRVETDCGTRSVELLRENGRVVRARAGLGSARIVEREARLSLPGEPPELVRAVLVDLGNPHCVVFVDTTGLARLGTLGPLLAGHARFPAGTNVELALAAPAGARAPRTIRARVWERGVGETAACGTGAAAVAVAAAETGRGALPLAVALPGGLLEVERDPGGGVWLAGPVAHGGAAERDPAESPA